MDVPIGNAPVSSIQCMASRHAAPVKQTAQRLFFALRPALFVLASLACAGTAVAQPAELSVAYREQVPQRLDLPPDAVLHYAELAREQFQRAGVPLLGSQYVAVVDRSPQVQAILVYWVALGEPALLIGASPVSTGRVGQFDHFETPLGVFDLSLSNPDFRAEGTRNEFGFRGYGAKGMRVYDLGWQKARRGWGKGGDSTMRLQMHATDPVLAEHKLGSVQSKGCIRIPAALNRLLDHFGVLDADYETAASASALAEGTPPWVLAQDRRPISDAGRYLVVVDSQRDTRPDWSPAPLPLPLP